VEAAGDARTSVGVELRGVLVRTHHGVSEAEREVGQRLEIDVFLEPAECEALHSDRVEDTIDYGEVCETVVSTATERSYQTLERLAQVTCERLLERFGAHSVRVRAAKPEPPLPVTMTGAAVEVSLTRPDVPGSQ
jgi:dihydroneopterin aldolase